MAGGYSTTPLETRRFRSSDFRHCARVAGAGAQPNHQPKESEASMTDVEPSTVFALLRACLAGDEAGAAAIVGTADPLPLVFALAAWANEVGVGQYGGREAWDAQLEAFLREGPVDAA
jgi:hypothetical protein